MSTVIRCSPAKRKAPRASAGPERQESPTTSQRIVSRAYPVNSSLRTWCERRRERGGKLAV